MLLLQGRYEFWHSYDDNIEMIVELPDGRKETLQIKSNDDPQALAKKFCFHNNLDIRIINNLAKNIRNFIS